MLGTTSVVRSIQNLQKYKMLSDVRITGHDFLQVFISRQA